VEPLKGTKMKIVREKTPMVVYTELDSKDPLDRIVGKKLLVEHLRSNEIDGRVIQEILGDHFGIKLDYQIRISDSEKAKLKKISYALRTIDSLVGYEVITDEEKDYLRGIKVRIIKDNPMAGMKRKAGLPCVKLRSMEGNAKNEKQTNSFQAVEIYKYVDEFITNRDMFLHKDIYELIAELLEFSWNKYTWTQIKDFVRYNEKYLE
jgi:hypothetical protein